MAVRGVEVRQLWGVQFVDGEQQFVGVGVRLAVDL